MYFMILLKTLYVEYKLALKLFIYYHAKIKVLLNIKTYRIKSSKLFWNEKKI